MRCIIGQPSDGDIMLLSDEEDPWVWWRSSDIAADSQAVGGLLARALVRPGMDNPARLDAGDLGPGQRAANRLRRAQRPRRRPRPLGHPAPCRKSGPHGVALARRRLGPLVPRPGDPAHPSHHRHPRAVPGPSWSSAPPRRSAARSPPDCSPAGAKSRPAPREPTVQNQLICAQPPAITA